MQQIANWLESLGLGEYTQRFAENRIDASVLCDLTDQDLEKIGIPLGHRNSGYPSAYEDDAERAARGLRAKWRRRSRKI